MQNSFNHKIVELYEKDPALALEYVISHQDGKAGFVRIWQSQLGKLGKTRYGLYRKFNRENLIGRSYNIELHGDEISIFWADVVFDENLYRAVSIY